MASAARRVSRRTSRGEDVITMQVVRYALEQIADEMGYTLVRTARSPIIKEVMDITCAVFDARGRTIAQAHHAPMLLTGFEITMRELIRRYPPDQLDPGDVLISNDPYMGGQHIPDVQTFAPIHVRGDLVGFVGSIGHQSDMGGAAPGGVAGGMTEIFQEGIRIPMLKLVKRGEENRDLVALLRNNIRVPDNTLGDIRAQAGSNMVGVRRVQQLYAKYGGRTIDRCLDMLLDVSERRVRAGIDRLPDGRYSGTVRIDNDGVTDAPIPITVNIAIRGGRAKVDFTGTSLQVKGNVNCPLATTHAAVFYAMIVVADPHVPPNSGCYRPVAIDAAEGLVVNPRPPAALAARTNCSQKITEAMFLALSKVAPDRVMAGSHAQITTNAFSGFRDGKRWVYTEIQGGGAGARPTKDGREGQDSHLARFMNTPVEAIEIEYPVRVECYALIPDSGGPGRTRGACGLRRDMRFLTDDVSWSRYGDSQEFPPFGLFGGESGAPGRFILDPGTPGEARAKSKGVSGLRKGQVVSLRLPGGGGYGPPTERDPDAVAADVRHGIVSPGAARDVYRVVLDAAGRPDRAATQALRRDGGSAGVGAPTRPGGKAGVARSG